MAGRIPKPTKIHLMNGNPSRLNLDDRIEPEPDVKIPECPRHLKGEARKEWNRISLELFKLGLISEIDVAALSAYCSAWADYVYSDKKIRRMKDEGYVFETSRGFRIQEPLFGIKNRSLEIMHKFLTEFGMTPASRSRLAVTGKKKTTDPLEELLAGVN